MLVICFIYPLTVDAALEPIFIREYLVKGAHHLTRTEIEEAVYRYLGPGRTRDDVEKARAALEKAYQDKGYQTVSVQIPPQPWRDGSIILEVTEAAVGRLRVHRARYFLPSQIKAMAPSVAEGTVPNFNDVTRDILALNQYADERVTPALRPGVMPNTVDIDLDVKDTLPLHGSLELNNRYSENTSQLRLNGAVSYNNLWQLGHSIGGSFELSPEEVDQVKVFSGYYLFRIPEVTWWSLSVQGTKQDSSVSIFGPTAVSTLGQSAVAGRGETIGFLSTFVLPGGKEFSDTLSLGVDYKDGQNTVNPFKGAATQTSYHYFPVSATYSATWITTNNQTEFDITPECNFRGVGSNPNSFEAARVGSSGNFATLHGDLSDTRELPAGFQLYGKVQGQVADGPLVSQEQFGGGGLYTARGYLEGEAFGDDAMFGAVELRTPSITQALGYKDSEWRGYVFAEAGRLTVINALPEQISQFDLADFGVGTRIRLADHLNGSLDLGIPVLHLPGSAQPTNTSSSATAPQIRHYDPRLTFRLWAEF
ncbi:MAG TPA: ShlB/FhaC/HecB family hemolysin secretion/activation protein [Verrucomicrobiae bacterium]|nr:ShlB/FhaC/HecB family hemolysin secretion/activation protein [Verrucomicrobiae bacterium]